MKAYGYHRQALIECRFGCCTERDNGKHRKSHKILDRVAKKNGRRITPRLFTELLGA